jgi:hypothetical protein
MLYKSSACANLKRIRVYSLATTELELIEKPFRLSYLSNCPINSAYNLQAHEELIEHRAVQHVADCVYLLHEIVLTRSSRSRDGDRQRHEACLYQTDVKASLRCPKLLEKLQLHPSGGSCFP